MILCKTDVCIAGASLGEVSESNTDLIQAERLTPGQGRRHIWTHAHTWQQ